MDLELILKQAVNIDQRNLIIGKLQSKINKLYQDPEEKQTNKAKEYQDLIEKILQLPIAKLFLAYSPTDEQEQELADLLRKKLNEKLFLQIEYVNDVCPGCILEFSGKEYDLTLSKEFKKYE